MRIVLVLLLAAGFATGASAAVRHDERATLLAPAAQQSAGFGRVATSADVAVIGASGEDSNTGAVYVFERVRGGFRFRQRLVATVRTAGDLFGTAVDVDDDTIVVGASATDGIGAAYVFTRDATGAFVERQKLVGDVREAGDAFGASVAIDGDDVLVGAPAMDVGIITRDGATAGAKGNILDVGGVYHFERRSGSFTQRGQRLCLGFALAGDRCGTSVAIDGNRFVTGSFFGDGIATDTGNAWVYTRTAPGTDWGTTPQELFAPDGSASDLFSRVAIDGGVVVVGAPGDDTSAVSGHGSAYVFRFGAGSFAFSAKLLPQTLAGNAGFGIGVALEGNVAAFGAIGGFAELFEDAGGSFAFAQRVTGHDTTGADAFGFFVALADNTLLVGATARAAGSTTGAGAAYVFERDEASRLARQRRYTTTFAGDPDRGRFDLLGSSVAINDRWLVAGAPGVTYFNSATLSHVRAGVAYVFDRTQATPPAVLRGASGANGDLFGHAVAISPDGNTIVVGAPGVGTQNEGAVYVFNQPPGGWSGTLVSSSPGTIFIACRGPFELGYSVAVRNDGLIVAGSPGSDTPVSATPGTLDTGTFFELRPNGAGYTMRCYIATGAPMARYGHEVVLDGDDLYVSAPGVGFVDHWDVGPSPFAFRHKITESGVSTSPNLSPKQITGNKFGVAIDAEGDTLVIGAPLADTTAGADAGMAYVYDVAGTTIDATAQLIGDKFGAGANAGASVATNGDVIVLGAPLADPGGIADAGGAYGYERPVGGWLGVLMEDGALDAPDPNTGGQFGFDVAATADAIAIGEPQDDGPTIDGVPADDQGSAFAFDFAEFMLHDGFE